MLLGDDSSCVMSLSTSYSHSSNEIITILLLLEQMGKFYELFEMDAHVGAKELDLQYMKVSAGSSSFSTWLEISSNQPSRLSLNLALE